MPRTRSTISPAKVPKVAEASRLSSSQNQKQDASATLSPTPKGRKTAAQGNALGLRTTTNRSPEGAAQCWPFVRLAEAGVISGGLTKNSKRDGNELQVSYLRVGNVYQNELRLDEIKNIGLTEREFAKTRLEKGDLLIVEGNGSKDQIGRLAIWDGSVEPCVHQNHLIRVRLSERVLPKFAVYWFSSQEGRARIEHVASSTSGLYTLSLSKIGSLELPLPPLSEQRRIVARIEELFSRLEAGVAALRHAKAQLQRYRQSVLAAAVTGQLTQAWREQHPDTEPAEDLLKRILKRRREQWNGRRKYNEPIAPAVADLPDIPASWTWISPAQLSAPEDYSLAIGPFGSNLKVSDYTDAGVPLVFVRHIRANDYKLTPKFVSAEKASELKAHSVDPGDLLVTKMGEPPGDASLYPENRPHAIITADCIKLRLTNLIVSKSFFVNAINSQLVAKQIAPITRGVAQKKISLDRFRDIALPLPPIAEQHQIVAEVEARTTAIDHLETELDRQIARASRLRQSILAKAFTGGLVGAMPALLSPVEAKLSMPQAKKRPNRHFARALLSAEIVHRLHGEPTFGRIKHQKIFHLCEHIARIEEIEGQYHREAAGPLDNKLIYSNEVELKKQKWYREIRRDSYGHAYEPMEKAGAHQKYLEGNWPDQLPMIERLIELMRTWSTDRCEIFCTAYTAWNDLILWGKDPTDEAILHEILDRWHPSKKRFGEDRWRQAIGWMKDQEFVPTGFGNPSSLPTSK